MKPAGLDESRARFEGAWGELADAVQGGIGLRPRPTGLGLLVLAAAAGMALAWGGKVFWAELRHQSRPKPPGGAGELGD